jgi:hypothetical protein
MYNFTLTKQYNLMTRYENSPQSYKAELHSTAGFQDILAQTALQIQIA